MKEFIILYNNYLQFLLSTRICDPLLYIDDFCLFILEIYNNNNYY